MRLGCLMSLHKRLAQSSSELREGIAAAARRGVLVKGDAISQPKQPGELKGIVKLLWEIYGDDTRILDDLDSVIAGRREFHEFEYADDLRHVRDLLTIISLHYKDVDPELGKDADDLESRINHYLEDM